ncbi:MAG: hypothetical protein IT385_07980 [Deltaproteobacteria bacterium]|nr:hypothetical protein [Deltaproteobacteria bacterium]
MRWIESLLACLSFGCLLYFAWPEGARPLSHVPAAWHAPPRPTAHCGAALAIVAVLADPVHVADAAGELVRLRNLEPEPLDLEGWRITRGGAHRPLDDVVLEPGAILELSGPTLRPVKLPNRGGELLVRDPCGVVTSFTWQPSGPGHFELAEHEAVGAM